MAFVRDTQLTALTSNSTSFTADLPSDYATGDTLVLFVIKDSSVGSVITTPSGWTLAQSDVTSSEIISAIFYKENVTAASETNPTVTNTDDDTWIGIIVSVGGVPTTSVIDVSSIALLTSSSAETSYTGPTTSSNNSLVLHAFGGGATYGSMLDSKLIRTVEDPGVSSESLQVYEETLATAGASSSGTCFYGGDNNMTYMTIALKDATSGVEINPKQLSGGADAVLNLFQAVETDTYLPSGLPSGITTDAGTTYGTVGSLAATAAVTLVFDSTDRDFSATMKGLGMNNARQSVASYSGGRFELDRSGGGAVYDLSSSDTVLAFGCYTDGLASILQMKNRGEFGAGIILEDSVGNWSCWSLFGKDSARSMSNGEQLSILLDPSNTSTYATSGTLDTTDLKYVAFITQVDNIATSSLPLYATSLVEITPLVIGGGTSTRLIDLAYMSKVGRANNQRLIATSGNASTVLGKWVFGNASLESHMTISGKSINIPAIGNDEVMLANNGYNGFEFNASANCVFNFTECTVDGGSEWEWAQLTGSGTQNYTDNTLINAKPVTLGAADYSGTTFRRCATITQNGATLDNCTINNSLDGVGAILDLAGSFTALDVRNCTVGVEFTTAGTVNLDGMQFTGNTTDLEFSGTGTLDVIITNGADTPTVVATGGGTINLIDPSIIVVTNGTTYTVNSGTKFLVDTDTVSTFTISGIIPPEIEHIGSGTTTINGINNAKLTNTTITATGGTLTIGTALALGSEWTFASNVLTLNSGQTVTNLEGIKALAEVTYSGSDTFTTFRLDPAVQLVIAGTLTLDPDNETIIVQSTPSATGSLAPIYVTGTLNLGVTKTGNGNTVYAQGTVLTHNTEATNFYGFFGLYVSATGTITWNGGTVNVAASWGLADGATLTINKGTFYSTTNSNSKDWTIRTEATGSNGDRINIYDLTLNGKNQPTRFDQRGTAANVVLRILNGGLQAANVVLPTQIDILNFDTSSNLLTNDISAGNDVSTRNTEYRFQNVAAHLNLFAYVGRYIYCTFYRQVDLTIQDTNDVGITYSYYAIDNDSGNRTVGGGGQDDTADKVYAGTDVTGTLSENMLFEVLIMLNSVTTTDDRTNGTDSLDILVVGYTEVITTVMAPLLGLYTYSENVNCLPDLSITEAIRATVDAYTTLDDVYEFYDRAKSELVANYAGESVTTVNRIGATLDLGSRNLIIDASAVSAYDLDGSTITIKSTTFTGNITTTGLVTYLNGSTVDGVVTDSTGTTGLPGVSISNLPINAKLFISGYSVQTATISGIVKYVLAPATNYTVLISHPDYKERMIKFRVETTEVQVDGTMELYTVKNNLPSRPDANFSFVENAGVITITDTDGEFIVQNLVKGVHQYNYDNISTTGVFGIFKMILSNYVEVSRSAQLIQVTSPISVTDGSIRKIDNTPVFSPDVTVNQVSG